MTIEERNNQQFQQPHYGGIVQGIPVVDNPSAPPLSASSNHVPPTYPPPTAAPVASTGSFQNHVPPTYPPSTAAPIASTGAYQNHVPPSSTMPGDFYTTANATPSTNTNTATAISNTNTVIIQPAPIVVTDGLPCGCGTGWFMFILGWFFGIPWYVGACILICGKIDPRERPGHIACAVMAGILTIALIVTSTHHASNGY